MPTAKATSTAAPVTSTTAKRPAAKRSGTPRRPTATAKAVGATNPSAQMEVAASKQKLVRDSFTIPKSEFEVLNGLKQRAATLARPTKKSELLRAGIALLSRLPDKSFLAALNSVPSLKTGRPKHASLVDKAKAAKQR